MNVNNYLITTKQQNYSCSKVQAACNNPINNSKNALQTVKLNAGSLTFGKNSFPNLFKGIPQTTKHTGGFNPANTDINRDGGIKIKYLLKGGKNFEIEYDANFICDAQKIIKEKYRRNLTKYDLLNLNVRPSKIPSEQIESALASLKADNPAKYQIVKRI